MIKCVVFDLDGTLVRSHETIFKTTVRTLNELGLSTHLDRFKFLNLLGHHFKEIFIECEISVPDIEFFMENYKKAYFDYIDDSRLYQNVIDVLRELKHRKINTGLLTTKGQDQAEKIAAHFGLNDFLDSIEGRKNGIAIKPAPDQFLKICKKYKIHPQNSLMVGDTDLDIKCGKAAGAKTCAVSYGYRDVEELKLNTPDYIIDDPKKVLEIVGYEK